MQIRYRFFLWIFVLSVAVTSQFARADNPAIVQVYTFSSDSTLLKKGTGFFIDTNGMLITGQSLFPKASYAIAVTADSTVHRFDIVKTESRVEGWIKVSVDNTLAQRSGH